jgi:hypothetical protein
MTVQYVSGALVAIMLTCGLPTIAPAQTRDASLLPSDQSGLITVAGCLQRGGKDGDEWVLTNPRLGPIANVPEATCSAPIDHRSLELNETSDHGINESMLGRAVEVSGRIEKETDDDPANLRELNVRSFRMLPVVPPRAEAPAPPLHIVQQPVAPPEPTPFSEPAPVGTSGQTALPETASPLPMIGFFGLLSLAGGLAFRLYRSHERG